MGVIDIQTGRREEATGKPLVFLRHAPWVDEVKRLFAAAWESPFSSTGSPLVVRASAIERHRFIAKWREEVALLPLPSGVDLLGAVSNAKSALGFLVALSPTEQSLIVSLLYWEHAYEVERSGTLKVKDLARAFGTANQGIRALTLPISWGQPCEQCGEPATVKLPYVPSGNHSNMTVTVRCSACSHVDYFPRREKVAESPVMTCRCPACGKRREELSARIQSLGDNALRDMAAWLVSESACPSQVAALLERSDSDWVASHYRYSFEQVAKGRSLEQAFSRESYNGYWAHCIEPAWVNNAVEGGALVPASLPREPIGQLQAEGLVRDTFDDWAAFISPFSKGDLDGAQRRLVLFDSSFGQPSRELMVSLPPLSFIGTALLRKAREVKVATEEAMILPAAPAEPKRQPLSQASVPASAVPAPRHSEAPVGWINLTLCVTEGQVNSVLVKTSEIVAVEMCGPSCAFPGSSIVVLRAMQTEFGEDGNVAAGNVRYWVRETKSAIASQLSKG